MSDKSEKITITYKYSWILQVVLAVFAILVNFTNTLDPSKFPLWVWNALEGWSAIPVVIFVPWLVCAGIVIVLGILTFIFGLIFMVIKYFLRGCKWPWQFRKD